jgi:peptide/nickel transport system permease protein
LKSHDAIGGSRGAVPAALILRRTGKPTMFRYALARLLLWIPTVLVVLMGVYALAYYGAGDPIKLIFLRAPGDVAYDPAKIEAIREQAGLNRPFIAQFGSYIWNLLHGNFGNSLVSGRPVWRMISAAMPVSMTLGLMTIILTAFAAIPLGVVAALRQNSKLDYLILGSALLLWAIPAYVAGPLLMVLLILVLPNASIPYGWGGLFDARIILPLAVLAFQPIALIVRQTRAAVIEVLSEDFVRTAKAKGVPSWHLVTKHILRPALTPVVTQLGLIMITIINGAIFVELVFGLPGLGRLTVKSLMDSDFPVILAITLIGSFLVMISNLLVDLVYPLLDPRATGTRTGK